MLTIVLTIAALILAGFLLRAVFGGPKVALSGMSTSQRIDAMLTMADVEYAAATGR